MLITTIRTFDRRLTASLLPAAIYHGGVKGALDLTNVDLLLRTCGSQLEIQYSLH